MTKCYIANSTHFKKVLIYKSNLRDIETEKTLYPLLNKKKPDQI